MSVVLICRYVGFLFCINFTMFANIVHKMFVDNLLVGVVSLECEHLKVNIRKICS